MIKVNSLKEIDCDFGLTIGNFDGVHLGHRNLIDNIKNDCQKTGLKFCLLTFNPHPKEILNSSKNFLISSYEEKRELLSTIGIDYYFELQFNRDFSTQSPSQFLDDFILPNKMLKKIYVGYDFCFGKDKKGNFDFIKNYEGASFLTVKNLLQFNLDDESVSSTSIREKIEAGKIDEANTFLGRKFSISGRIKKGDQRGRQIGFPTANLDFNENRIYPANGVYQTQFSFDGNTYNSITNVGFKPTFSNKSEINIETHIFDFDADIYGKRCEVFFIKKIREEMKFETVNALVSQIKEDIKIAKE